jgi:hypothetical protein
VPRQPVGDRAADQQEQHQRQGAGCGHQTDVAAVPAGFEDGERGGDEGPVAAEARDERGSRQQAVVAAGPGGSAQAGAGVGG